MVSRKLLGLFVCACLFALICLYEYVVSLDHSRGDGTAAQNIGKFDSENLHGARGVVTSLVAPLAKSTYDKVHKSGNSPPGGTFYRWNDLIPITRQKLPIKKLKNGTFAPSGLTVQEATKAVMYTRVPKTGSRFMLALLRNAAVVNHFNMIYSTVYNHSSVFSTRASFARDVGRFRTPFLMARQLYFLDFTEFRMAQPMYISIIRDPVDRVVSSFNFNRFGDGTSNAWYKMYKADRKLTLDNCITRNKTECSVEGASVTIRYFCGQNPRCKAPSDWSLEQAIANVERHYLFVGLLEQYENTLKVMEKLFPSFFKGIASLYKTDRSKTTTASKKHYTASPKAKEILRARFHLEYEFYNFVKNRFETLMKKLEI